VKFKNKSEETTLTGPWYCALKMVNCHCLRVMAKRAIYPAQKEPPVAVFCVK